MQLSELFDFKKYYAGTKSTSFCTTTSSATLVEESSFTEVNVFKKDSALFEDEDFFGVAALEFMCKSKSIVKTPVNWVEVRTVRKSSFALSYEREKESDYELPRDLQVQFSKEKMSAIPDYIIAKLNNLISTREIKPRSPVKRQAFLERKVEVWEYTQYLCSLLPNDPLIWDFERDKNDKVELALTILHLICSGKIDSFEALSELAREWKEQECDIGVPEL